MASLWGVLIGSTTTRTNAANGDKAVADTLAKMIQVTRYSAGRPLVKQAVDLCLLKIKPPVSSRELARQVFWYVKSRVRFETDEQILMEQFGFDPQQANDTELILAPELLLSVPEPMGDCDCFAVLTASMLVCAGMPTKFVSIAVDDNEPWRWSHVFCRTYIKEEGRWLAMDTSHGDLPGWETSRVRYREMEWTI